MRIREATREDAAVVGRMFHAFNSEFEDVTPGPEKLAERIALLIDEGDTAVLLGGDGPDGFAILRFRRALVTPGRECYLAELYVRPEKRGQGIGRAIMERALELAKERGADGMDLGTGHDDRAARALYESLGFVNDGGNAPGSPNYFYEKDL
jgi:ribosomal protein S18 acetylase RimI-like enzyme